MFSFGIGSKEMRAARKQSKIDRSSVKPIEVSDSDSDGPPPLVPLHQQKSSPRIKVKAKNSKSKAKVSKNDENSSDDSDGPPPLVPLSGTTNTKTTNSSSSKVSANNNKNTNSTSSKVSANNGKESKDDLSEKMIFCQPVSDTNDDMSIESEEETDYYDSDEEDIDK